MQSLGPTLKGLKQALSSLSNSAGASFSQRSGMNSSGRWKLVGSLYMAHRFMVKLVLGGTTRPATTTLWPPEVRNKKSAAGGYSRSPSLITALRYSCCWRLTRFMSSIAGKSVRMTETSLCRTSGCCKRRYTVPEIIVAATGLLLNLCVEFFRQWILSF